MSFLVLIFFVVNLIFPKVIFANSNFVTIVNPVRLSEYTENEHEGLNAQYNVIKELDLPATWLLTYDSLSDKEIVDSLSRFNSDQEKGIFLEITKDLCHAAEVSYNNKFSWHHSGNVFLTGYKQMDRIKLIDRVFSKFKDVFGYYPKSVGAWWIDSYSLSYISEKYGVVANLGLADQYSTDGYRVWGTYWSTPFYPSKVHAGMPANSASSKINLVTTQWAPRDPWNGYFDSYYSTQDYLQTQDRLKTSYFEKLVRFYSNSNLNRLGHVTVGLEGDLGKEAYNGEYRKQMQVVAESSRDGHIEVINMSDFSMWYKKEFPEISPVQLVESQDLLGKDSLTYWYNSPIYRIGINYADNLLTIFDWRVYQNNFYEPYYFSPNKDFNLRINIPSLIDKVGKNNEWKITAGKKLSEKFEDDNLKIDFEYGSLVLERDRVTVVHKGLEVPGFARNNYLIEYSKNRDTYIFKAKKEFQVGEKGLTIISVRNNWFSFIKYNLNLHRFSVNKWIGDIFQRNYVSQSEIEALLYLKSFSKGKVLVYDNTCWGCEWNTNLKPAVFDNNRSYVSKFSGQKTIYNKSVFEAKDQKIAKEEFDKTGAKYIYVTNYEGQIEKVPFSPGDLGVELIYENANAQLWKKI